MSQNPITAVTTVGIDIGKNSFHIVATSVTRSYDSLAEGDLALIGSG